MSEFRLEMREICKSFPGVKALNGEAIDNYYWVDYVMIK